MKKLLTLVMTAVLGIACVFGMTACGGEQKTVKVGAQSSTTGFNYASCIKGVEAVGYDTPALAAQDMLNGKIDYLIVDGATAGSLVKTMKGLKTIDISLTEEQYAIGVDPVQTELLNKINNILNDKSAEIAAILAKEESEFVAIEKGTKDSTKADKQLVVATNAEFNPFEYVEGDKYKGFDMEIAKLIADELGMELVIEDMAFESVVSAVGKNDIDIVMAALTVTADRKTSLNFSNAYYLESQVIVVAESNKALDECGTVIDVLSVLSANK